jgi:hypothetical protein
MRLVMKTSLMISMILLAEGCLFAKSATPPPMPKDWVHCKKPDLTQTQAIGPEWDVFLIGGKLKIIPAQRKEELKLPFEVIFNPHEGVIGDQHVIRDKDGWLVGYNGGEFGGSLWWFSQNGKQRKHLADERVLGFLAYPTGVIILTGLAHLSTTEGSVLFIAQETKKIRRLADLGSPPANFFKESDHSLLAVSFRGGRSTAMSIGHTNAYLMRITLTGKTKNFLLPEANLLAAKSMVVLPNGTINVGYGTYIARLTPSGKSYREEWFHHTALHSHQQAKTSHAMQ